MPTHSLLKGCCLVGVCFLGFMQSSSSSSVSYSHLSPTASNSNLPCIGRLLTSVKFWCKVDWSNKRFGPIRTSHILQPWKWLEICKCQQTITPHQRTKIGLAGNKLASFTLRFPYFLETLCPYFEKYRCTSVLLANFCTNRGKYGWVGRSAISEKVDECDQNNLPALLARQTIPLQGVLRQDMIPCNQDSLYTQCCMSDLTNRWNWEWCGRLYFVAVTTCIRYCYAKTKRGKELVCLGMTRGNHSHLLVISALPCLLRRSHCTLQF